MRLHAHQVGGLTLVFEQSPGMLPGPRHRGMWMLFICSLTGNKEVGKRLVVLWIRPAPTRFPTNSLYAPVDSTPWFPQLYVWWPWGEFPLCGMVIVRTGALPIFPQLPLPSFHPLTRTNQSMQFHRVTIRARARLTIMVVIFEMAINSWLSLCFINLWLTVSMAAGSIVCYYSSISGFDVGRWRQYPLQMGLLSISQWTAIP